MDVFRPTAEWGPGDRTQKKMWLEKKRPRRECFVELFQQNILILKYVLFILQMYSRGMTIPPWLTPTTTTLDTGATITVTCNT